MRGAILAVIFGLLLPFPPVLAQTGGQRGHSRTGAVLGSDSPGMLRTIWGRVMFENGSTPAAEVAIELVCRGRPIPVARLDSRGRFQFDVGSRTPGGPSGGVPGIENGCVLQAALIGYRSSQVFVRDPDALETLDVGTIVLRPVAEQAGATVAITTASAPPKARAAYDNALKLLEGRRPNPAKALAQLEKAVAEYSNFAEAWNRLGELRMATGDDANAEAAFRSALAADPKFTAPYSALIRIEFSRQNWDSASMLAGNLLALQPGDEQAQFALAVANFNLGELEAAKSAIEKIHSGAGGEDFPESYELLGHILARQGQFAGAALQFRAFLNARPQAPSAGNVKARLAEWEQLGLLNSSQPNSR